MEREPMTVVGETRAHGVGLYWADAAHLLPDVLAPEVKEEDYLEQLVQRLQDEHVDVLLVALDFELPRLAKHRQRVEDFSDYAKQPLTGEPVGIVKPKTSPSYQRSKR